RHSGRRDARRDRELSAAVELHVGSRVRVVLLLVVSPAADPDRATVPDVVIPLGGVHARAGGAIELVAPGELEVFLRRWRRRVVRDGRRMMTARGRGDDAQRDSEAVRHLYGPDRPIVTPPGARTT